MKTNMMKIFTTKILLISVILSALIISVNAAEQVGVCSHPYTKREIDVRTQLFAKMKEANVKWLRTDIPWDHVLQKDGSFKFDIFDEIYTQMHANGIQFLPILNAYCGNHLNPTISAVTHPKEWVEYIKATVRHFKGRLKYWEVINEPDLAPDGLHTNDKNEGRGYGKALQIAYKAIKEVDPDAIVVYGGLAGTPKKYLEESLKVAGTSTFDIMNFHTYPAPAAPEPTFKKSIELLNELMQKYGEVKPIWITETGASTPVNIGINTITTPVRKELGLKNISAKNVFAIVDKEFGMDAESQAKEVFPDAKKIEKIKYSQIKRLGKNDILVLPLSESFPYAFASDLVAFVKNGGSLFYCGQGFPFNIDLSKPKNANGKYQSAGTKLMRMLRIGFQPHWTIDKTAPSSTNPKHCKGVGKFKDVKTTSYFRLFNFNDKLLKGNDKFLPIICATVNNKEYVCAAAYKFDSDFKGSVVLISAFHGRFVSKQRQAEIFVRSFLYGYALGVEKIFVYNFRDHLLTSPYEGNLGIVHKDFTPKPAFNAFKFLNNILANDSKPKLIKEDDIFAVSFKSSANKNVLALWTKSGEKNLSLSVKGKSKIFDMLGNDITENCKLKNIKIQNEPIYVISASEITIK